MPIEFVDGGSNCGDVMRILYGLEETFAAARSRSVEMIVEACAVFVLVDAVRHPGQKVERLAIELAASGLSLPVLAFAWGHKELRPLARAYEQARKTLRES